MIFKTCRLKQTVLFTLAAIFLLSALAVVVYQQFSHELYAAVDKTLMETARHKLQSDLDPGNLADNEAIIKRNGNDYYEISKRSGTVLVTPLDGQNKIRPSNRKTIAKALNGELRFDTAKYVNARYRLLYYPVGKDEVLRVSHSLEGVDEETSRLRALFLLYLPLAALMAYFLSWVLAGRIIAPIIKMKSFTERVRKDKALATIEMVPTGREIDDLVKIMNEMLESLHHSVEFQSRFTSDVSHEIRSPLTSLRGSIEVALRRKRTPEEYEQVLKRNLSDIFRLSKITDNLLFLAKADNNILELRKQRFDVNLMLHNIAERFKYNASNSGIALSEDYSEGVELYGDADLLDQAFSNLIDNAIKYTLQGGRVGIGTQKDTEGIRISISDTGIGIPKEEIPHIFDRFHRVSMEGSKKLGGTGLGLSITHWIISQHNGKIEIKSSVGSGTDFTVTFPQAAG